MRVSHSKLKTYRRCPNQFRYKYVWKIRPREKVLQLERGSWIHELLMVHYDGESWRERHGELSREFYNLFEEEREMLGDLPTECFRIMRSYERTYKKEDEQYHVIDSEVNELVTLPNGIELNVIVDLIVEESDGGLWAWDHKTRDRFENMDNMLLDPQLTVYYWALQQLGYKPMRGVLYNEIRTKAPAVPQLLQSGGLSKRRNIDTDIWTYMAEIRRYGLDPNDYASHLHHIARNQRGRFFRRVMLPKDKPMIRQMMKELVWSTREMERALESEQFPRTFQTSCRWDCHYTDICIAELHGADPAPIVKHGFIKKESD